MKTSTTSSWVTKLSFRTTLLIVAVIVLLVVSMLSVSLGRYRISVDDILKTLFQKQESKSILHVVNNLRFPRLFASILVGASLSSAGVIFQSIFKNPLVSPDLLGVTSGASVGAAFAIILGFESSWIPAYAFVSGIISVGICLCISIAVKNKSNLILLFAGVIVGRLADSIVGMIKYFADTESQLGDIVNWQLGSMAKVTSDNIPIMISICLPCMFLLLLLRWHLNILSLGEEEAQTLGINVVFERAFFIVLATLLTAISVCFCGTISWIGLVIPHIARWIVGNDNRYTLPLSMTMGAIFLVAADLCARTLTDYELPLGIITGFIGAPIFAIVLIKRMNNHE